MSRGRHIIHTLRPAWSLGSLALLLASEALAASTNSLTLSPAPDVPSLGYSVFRLFGALTLVIALLLGLAWLARNWQRFAVSNGRPPRLSVLEVRSLGARHALYVVGYERQRFLLSSAPNGISLLTNLPPASEGDAEPAGAPAPAFTEVLARAFQSSKGLGQ